MRFRELSVWDRYKAYILAALALLMVQSALIAGLLIQRARRRHAEVGLRRSQEHLLTSHEYIRDLGSRLLNAQEAERSRIARELHDDINQQMAMLAMDLDFAGGTDSGDLTQKAAEARARVQEIAKSVRDLSHRLHPARLRLMGLVPRFRRFDSRLSQPGIAIAFTHDSVPSTLSPDLTLCLFRVVQEALHNAIKYSKARDVSVHLGGSPLGLTLSVADDGVGFDVEARWGKGLGLVSISERIEAAGGTLDIHSTPGAGTFFAISIPLGLEPATGSPMADPVG